MIRNQATQIAIFTTIFFIAACSSSKKTTTVGKVAKENKIEIPHYSAAELEEGKTIWQGSCDRCHKLYAPESRTVAKWEKVLPRMVKRAKLNDDQAGKVRGYLMSLAKS